MHTQNTTWVFEIFSEQIPARMQKAAAEQLQKILENQNIGKSKAYCTTRRLTAIIDHLPTHITEQTEQKRGPKTSAPQEVIEKFIEKTANSYKQHNNTSLSAENLKQQTREENGHIIIPSQQIDIPIKTKLEKLSHQILQQITWPLTMQWLETQDLTWIRPIRGFVSLLNADILPFQSLALQATSLTYNEQYEVINIPSAAEYIQTLTAAGIILDTQTRSQSLEPFIKGAAVEHELLELVSNSAEKIYPFKCKITNNHLIHNLPNILISTCVQEHQQAITIYLTTEKNATGEPKIDHFVLAAQKNPSQRMIEDSQKLLEARLEDLECMYKEDLSTPLDTWKGQLENCKIGKTHSTIDLMNTLHNASTKLPQPFAQAELLETIAFYQTVLVSKIVQEFPSLSIDYALILTKKHSINPRLLHEYQKLNGVNGTLLLLLENLLKIIYLFEDGLKVSGSSDPLGLKKIGNKIIQAGLYIQNSLLQSQQKIYLGDLKQIIRTLYPHTTKLLEITDFLKERMEFYQYKPRLSNANEKAITTSQLSIDNFWLAEYHKKQKQDIKPEDLERIQQMHKRLTNFIKKQTPPIALDTQKQNDDTIAQPLYKLLETIYQQPIDISFALTLTDALEQFLEKNIALDQHFLNNRLFLLQAFQRQIAVY